MTAVPVTEALATLQPLVLVLTLVSAALLAALLAANLRWPDFGFWPSARGWRHQTAFGLFRLFCGGIVAFALIEVLVQGWGHWARWVLGVPIMLGAYAITLWGYRFLGLENTYCASDGLVTGGMYAYSRNPQYVTSVMAAVGLAIAAGSWMVLALAAVLFVIYVLFILNEERWLMTGYGDAFGAYVAQVPRFVDQRSLIRVHRDLRDRSPEPRAGA